MSEPFKCLICLKCIQRAETTGETYIRAMLKIQDITEEFDNEPKKTYTDINWPVSYKENNNE